MAVAVTTTSKGELVEQTDSQKSLCAEQTDTNQVPIFNPLDAQPVAFKRQLDERSENYDALAAHLRNMLVPGKDFGRIHIAKKDKCPRWWECSHEREPYHWSPYMLFAAGADKVLGMLGLATSYPGEQDFIRAALTGKQIADVIMKCNIVGHTGQVISEGMGACSRGEVHDSLNNAIKRACKRARVDAVLRLPSISALFEDDFLAEIDRSASQGNSTSSRQRQVNQKHNTGAKLSVWPLKGKLEGQRFDQMEDGALDWILEKFQDKPDIRAAAERECVRRAQSQPEVTPDKSPPDDLTHENAEWLREYEDADEWNKDTNEETTP